MDLSIIIPAYNSKKTIGKTLESIQNQIIDYTFEIIIVNDCSNYNYSSFVKKYIDTINIREIKTPKNGGPGFARQYGIDNSDSKYIIFVDSDDTFYNKYAINSMIKKMNDEKSDLIISKFIYNRDNYSTVKNGDIAWLHGKMYRRKFLLDNGIRFNNSRANEDNGFNWLVVLLSAKISYLNMTTYSYNENVNSITRSNDRLYKFVGVEGFCYNMNWACEEAEIRRVDTAKIKSFLFDVMVSLYLFYINLYSSFNVNEIIIWGKDLYIKYKKYGVKYTKEEFKKIIDIKNKTWELNEQDKNNISFEDFLKIWKL